MADRDRGIIYGIVPRLMKRAQRQKGWGRKIVAPSIRTAKMDTERQVSCLWHSSRHTHTHTQKGVAIVAHCKIVKTSAQVVVVGRGSCGMVTNSGNRHTD